MFLQRRVQRRRAGSIFRFIYPSLHLGVGSPFGGNLSDCNVLRAPARGASSASPLAPPRWEGVAGLPDQTCLPVLVDVATRSPAGRRAGCRRRFPRGHSTPVPQSGTSIAPPLPPARGARLRGVPIGRPAPRADGTRRPTRARRRRPRGPPAGRGRVPSPPPCPLPRNPASRADRFGPCSAPVI